MPTFFYSTGSSDRKSIDLNIGLRVSSTTVKNNYRFSEFFALVNITFQTFSQF